MRIRNHRLFIILIVVLAVLGLSACAAGSNSNDTSVDTGAVDSRSAEGAATRDQMKTFKILHVMSYHMPWEWTDTQMQGLMRELDGIPVEYKQFEMDTKNFSTEEQKRRKAEEARALIDTWEPDLLYTTDDDAQEYVARHYANTSLPIVFSAVNKDPAAFGFDGAANVTGVLEVEHFIENINLLKEIVPDVRDIAVIFDIDPMWDPVEERMRAALPQAEGITILSWDRIDSFADYKRRIAELQTEADAIALIGIFTFQDEKGRNVHYSDVLEWTAANSKLPDFSFWKDRATFGTLSVVSVSGYEQGREAGRLARQILVDGKSPGSLPIRTSSKGEPIINKARADDLGIPLSSKTILGSHVMTEYGWDVGV